MVYQFVRFQQFLPLRLWDEKPLKRPKTGEKSFRKNNCSIWMSKHTIFSCLERTFAKKSSPSAAIIPPCESGTLWSWITFLGVITELSFLLFDFFERLQLKSSPVSEHKFTFPVNLFNLHIFLQLLKSELF